MHIPRADGAAYLEIHVPARYFYTMSDSWLWQMQTIAFPRNFIDRNFFTDSFVNDKFFHAGTTLDYVVHVNQLLQHHHRREWKK